MSQVSFFSSQLKLDVDFFWAAKGLWSRSLDALADIPVRRKTTALLFLFGVLCPLALLLVQLSEGEQSTRSALVLYIVAMIVLLVPMASAVSHLMALRSIRTLNQQCQRLKMGVFALEELPPERGEEHEFLRLRRNLHWMGYALKSREDRLSSTVSTLAQAQQQIGESLDYASLIQRAFLPGPAELGAMLGAAGGPQLRVAAHFLAGRQRESVGGDACWCKVVPDGFWVAIIDCTGHGVPGAFMTLIVHSLFERAYQNLGPVDEESPGALLSRVNRLIKEALGQTGGSALSDDGMDCSLCRVDLAAGRLVFAGAHGALYAVQGGEARVLKGGSKGAGYVRTGMDQVYADAVLPLEPGQRFYMTTDGLLDQVGGPKGLPFGRTRFFDFITTERALPLARQGLALLDLVDAYRGEEPQRDDITVMGFEIGPRSQA